MLGSLIKYEFKATYKVFFLLYALVLFFSFITRFTINFNDSVNFFASNSSFEIGNIALMIFMLIYFMLMITTGVLTIYIIVKRFYGNILGDSGYLMNTIPVAPWENILSKLSVGAVWLLLGMFVCFLSVIVLLTSDISLYELIRGINELIGHIDIEMFDIICNFILCVIIQQVSNIMVIYCSIAVGHLFNKHRKMAAVGVFLIIQVVIDTIAWNVFHTYGLLGDGFNAVLHFVLLFNMVVLVVSFIVTNYILKNRLNLE